LYDGHTAVDNVQLVGKVFQVGVERARDDGEDHVKEREDGSETEQGHVQVHLDVDVSPLVNFINILGATFAPIFFCQKITMPNCN